MSLLLKECYQLGQNELELLEEMRVSNTYSRKTSGLGSNSVGCQFLLFVLFKSVKISCSNDVGLLMLQNTTGAC